MSVECGAYWCLFNDIKERICIRTDVESEEECTKFIDAEDDMYTEGE